jgi:FHA domain
MDSNITSGTSMSNQSVHKNRCLRCGHNNSLNETFCEECGQVIDVSTSSLARKVHPQNTSDRDKQLIVLTFQTEKDTLSATLQPSQRATLGRLVPYMLLTPDIDLTPLNGAELGVSRNHAVLDYTSKGLHITDLDSRNGTFVNGKRLDSLNSLLLRDGDKLRFGQLEADLHLKVGPAALPVAVLAAATPGQGAAPVQLRKETRLLSPLEVH